MAKKPQKKAPAPSKGKPVKKSSPPPAKKPVAKKTTKAAPAKPTPVPVSKMVAKKHKPLTKPHQHLKRPAPPLKQVEILKPERNRLNSKLYRLRRKFETEGRKTYRDKIRRELKLVEKSRDTVSGKIKGLRQLDHRYDELKENKQRKKSRMRTLDSQLKKLWDKGQYDTKQYKQLNTEYMRLAEQVHDINQELGIEAPPKKFSEEDLEEIADSLEEKLEDQGKGWEAHPLTPHTVWQAPKELEAALDSGDYDKFYIDNNKFSGDDVTGIRFQASNFWRIVRSGTSGTPYVLIMINDELRAIKFQSYESA